MLSSLVSGAALLLAISCTNTSPFVGVSALPTTVDGFLRKETQNRPRPRLLEEEDSLPKLAGDYEEGSTGGFYHGVASGDPLADSVIIWTRWTPEAADDEVEVEVRMAKVDPEIAVEDHLDPSKNENLKRFLVTATAAHDWVVKLDVTGLESGSDYVYGFAVGDVVSRIGMTKTAPSEETATEQVQYAVFSCAHFSNGYFHSYDVASTLKDLDFWVHMGDYIYEYGSYSTYATSVPERAALTEPEWEIISVQDYRLRYAQYHRDEGLANLRARAPQVSIWDDHETMNDSYGDGTVERSGAENHEETCEAANTTSTDAEKNDAGCDRDEGPIDVRLNYAAQAYMEWMPIRKGPFGTMGFIDTDLTQVIEWGDLATLVLVDTRVSERSMEPAGQTTFINFSPAFANTNVTAYAEEPLLSQFQAIASATQEQIDNPSYTMIGSKVSFLEETFAASKAAGKPWQIFGSATMMGPQVIPSMATIAQFAPNEVAAGAVQQVLDFFLPTEGAAFFRAAAAMALTDTAWNLDDYNGYGNERAQILKMFQESANNGIVLGGDLHDSWAWQMYEGGAVRGNPVAINLGAPGTSSPGWEQFLVPIFAGVADFFPDGIDGILKMFNDAYEAQNPGLIHGSVGKRGFFVVTSTREESNIEYFEISAQDQARSFEAARAESSRVLTAEATCAAQLLSTAGEPGSLSLVGETCEVAQFVTERPAEWSIPFPESDMEISVQLTDGCGADACTVEFEEEDETDGVYGSSNGAIAGIVLGILLVPLVF